jgi:cytochrome c oxidase cbb3-type subunit 2
MAFLDKHKAIEKNASILLVLSLLVVLIGGLVQIVPLFYLQNTIENVQGMRPYTPLELAGRNIYIREGCYVCHSQMIRPMRDEVERYGHYSLAAESMYDHPFQWGSKRTGPDLARVGGKYSNTWHVDHLSNPEAIVPESVMPKYAYLATSELSPDYIDFVAQTSPDGDTSGLLGRYGAKVTVADFDGKPGVSEMDALVAYLQVLGTMVDFSTFTPDASR